MIDIEKIVKSVLDDKIDKTVKSVLSSPSETFRQTFPLMPPDAASRFTLPEIDLPKTEPIEMSHSTKIELFSEAKGNINLAKQLAKRKGYKYKEGEFEEAYKKERDGVTSSIWEDPVAMAVFGGGRVLKAAPYLKPSVLKSAAREAIDWASQGVTSIPSLLRLGERKAAETVYKMAKPKELLPIERLKPLVKKPVKGTALPVVTARELIKAKLPQTKSILPEKPSSKEIVDYLSETLDLPIRTGRYKGTAKGIYKIRAQVARTKLTDDVKVAAHEAGHHVRRILDLEIDKIYKDELVKIATPGKWQEEGFAEYFQLYLRDRNRAHAVAPQFTKYFEMKLQDEPILKNHFDKIYNRIVNLQGATTSERIGAQIVDKIPRKKLNVSEWIHSVYTDAIDKHHPIKHFGKKLLQDDRTYRLARLTEGWHGGVEHFLERGTYSFANKEVITGKSFKDVLLPIKKNLKDFEEYIVCKRAKELHGRNIETGLLYEDILETVKTKQSPLFDKAFDELKEYQDRVLNYLKHSGAIDQIVYRKMKLLNKDYVPFYRLMDDVTRKGTGKSFADVPRGVKKIGGSHAPIINPLESIIKNTYMFVNIAERNRVGQHLANWSTVKGSGKYIEKLPAKLQATRISSEEIAKGYDLPFDVSEELKDLLKTLGKGITVFRPNAFSPEKNVIRVWKEGKPILYQVHPDLYKSVASMNNRGINLLTKILSVPAKSLRLGAVVLNPEFLGRNPMRDQISAFLWTRTGYRPGLDMFEGLFSLLKKDKYYWDFKKYGGDHAALVSLDRVELQRKLKDVMSGRMKLKFFSPIEGMRKASEYMEATTRIGEFKRYIKKSKLAEELLPEIKEKAALAAREVTIDFSRRGASNAIRDMNSIIPFFNAQLQGLDRMARALKDNFAATSIKIFSGVTVPSILMFYHNKDREWYQNIDQWQKDLFWLIPAGGTDENPEIIIRIPKPFETGILFGSVPERMLDYIHKQDPNKINKLFKTLFEALTPSLLPQAIKTPIEVIPEKGWDFFKEKALIPESEMQIKAGYRESPYGSEIIKTIGHKLDISPRKIEHFIHGWTGGFGIHVTKGLDQILDTFGAIDIPEKPERSWADVPFVKAFVARYPTASSMPIDKFYKDYDRYERTYNTLIKLQREGRKHQIDEYINHNREDLLFYSNTGLRTMMGNTVSFIGKMRQVIANIYNDQSLPIEERKRQIEQTYLTITEAIGNVNNLIDNYRKNVKNLKKEKYAD